MHLTKKERRITELTSRTLYGLFGPIFGWGLPSGDDASLLHSALIGTRGFDGPHKETAKFLIRKGVNVNAHPDGASSPLILAAKHGLKEVSRLLLKNGANVNAENSNGETALLLAAREQQFQVLPLLIEAGAAVRLEDPSDDASGETPLIYAVKKGEADAVKQLLSAGARVNYTDDQGDPPPALCGIWNS